MSVLKITRGVPGSGKTTWAKEWVAENTENRARVNRDDIRFATFGQYWGVDEYAVTLIQNASLEAMMKQGKDIVSDNTHLKAKNVKETLKLAAKHGYEVEFEDFPISFVAAVWRDENRAFNGDRFVGEQVIKESFFDRFSLNYETGALPPVPVLGEPVAKFQPYSHTPGLPWCILVDIDGTLAHMGSRSPYDPTRYHEDTVDEVVRDLVNTHFATVEEVIVFSARDDTHREVTSDWLIANDVAFDRLYMRPTEKGNKREDSIVKNEMFEKHIAGKYNVRFILDDRDRVVNMFRAKGLKVLQVAPGDF